MSKLIMFLVSWRLRGLYKYHTRLEQWMENSKYRLKAYRKAIKNVNGEIKDEQLRLVELEEQKWQTN